MTSIFGIVYEPNSLNSCRMSKALGPVALTTMLLGVSNCPLEIPAWLLLLTVPSVFDSTYDACACQRFFSARCRTSIMPRYWRSAFGAVRTDPSESLYCTAPMLLMVNCGTSVGFAHLYNVS